MEKKEKINQLIDFFHSMSRPRCTASFIVVDAVYILKCHCAEHLIEMCEKCAAKTHLSNMIEKWIVEVKISIIFLKLK